MAGTAGRILLSEQQHGILQQMTRSNTTSQRLQQRAQVILLAFQGFQTDGNAGCVFVLDNSSFQCNILS